ncbi:hypothetical protein [Paenibacillus sp. GCM10028914]
MTALRMLFRRRHFVYLNYISLLEQIVGEPVHALPASPLLAWFASKK